MTTRLVSNLTDDVAALLQGTNLDNVTNLFGAYQRALLTMAQRIYIPEATGRQSVTLYDGVYNYAAPATIFGGSLIDFRPQGITRSYLDYVYKQPIEQFDRTKAILPSGIQITFEYNKGVPVMRVSQSKTTPRIILDPMNDDNWVASGSATTPVVDASDFYESPSSLRFNLTGASTGYITRNLSNAINLTDYLGVGVNFLALKIPTGANVSDLTSIALRLGSSASAYYEVTSTSGFLGAWTVGDFLLIAFDLATATTVGSPDITAIDYIRLAFVTAATITNLRVGQLFIALPSTFEIIFKSAAVFKSNGVLATTITSNSDQIMVTDPIYNIYQHECAITIALQNGGSFGAGVIASLGQILHGVRARNGAIIQLGLYDLYRADNPSEELKSTGNWYDD